MCFKLEKTLSLSIQNNKVMAQPIVYATDSTLMGIVKQKEPTLVMVFLPTCPHCRAIEPYFREYSKQYEDSVNFVMEIS
ncbi:hypothetical protein EFE40_09010 [Methanohalophilus halophilus]|uniref:Thioredoxin domain-containing protein n=2 Tax=Methanohalophilus halophilus TaxID=2177 RepID=A0A3M9L5G3_9EURY|nr:hypothetical protein EFE40_09010 [Methanohalophilus halophilus]